MLQDKAKELPDSRAVLMTLAIRGQAYTLEQRARAYAMDASTAERAFLALHMTSEELDAVRAHKNVFVGY